MSSLQVGTQGAGSTLRYANSVWPEVNRDIARGVSKLNSAADSVIDGMSQLPRWAGSYVRGADSALYGVSKTTLGTLDMAGNAKAHASYSGRFIAKGLHTSISIAGKVIDTVSHLGTALETLGHARATNNYSGFIKSAAKSVVQIGATATAGTIAAGALGAAIGVSSAPVVVAGGVALAAGAAAGYVAGKAVDGLVGAGTWVKSWF